MITNFYVEGSNIHGYYINMMYTLGNTTYTLNSVSNIIEHLNVEFNDFNKMVKLYNGSYSPFSITDIPCNVNHMRCVHFKNKNDANKFVTEYLDSLLLIKKLL